MSLSNNYSITFAEAATYLVAKASYPSGQGNKCITKNDADNYFYVNMTLLSGYGTQQLPKYQDIQPGYGIYLMTEYECDGTSCVETGLEKYGAFAEPFSPNYTRYYKPASFTGNAYKLINPFAGGSPAIIMNKTASVSCPSQAGCI